MKFSKFPKIETKGIFKTEAPRYVYILHQNKIIVHGVNKPFIKSRKFKNSTKRKKFWEKVCNDFPVYYIRERNFFISPFKLFKF